MEITIRQYEERDRVALRECMQKLQEHVAGIDPMHRLTLVPKEREMYIDWLLEKMKGQKGIIYIAVDREKVIGCAAGFVTVRSPHEALGTIPATPGRIQDLYVDAEYRSQGIGARLLKELENHFKAQGCDVVMVEVFAPNGRAIDFYHEHGFQDRDVDMLKKI